MLNTTYRAHYQMNAYDAARDFQPNGFPLIPAQCGWGTIGNVLQIDANLMSGVGSMTRLCYGSGAPRRAICTTLSAG